MRHIIFEDPITHRFAIIMLPRQFVDGDKLLIPSDLRWVATRDEALATLPELLNTDE